MKIEIWSDIMCPFCYMGKKQLELAIDKLPYKDEIEIIWRSFELNSEIKFEPQKTVTQYLAESKGMSIPDVERMQHKISEQGKELGIQFQFDKTPICNSRNAHKLLHIAQKQQKGNAFKEILFHSYFEEGKNVEDLEVLRSLAQTMELDLNPWNNDPFNAIDLEEEVNHDIYDAHQVGAQGVPFFVFNEAYALSGAHGADTIYKIIETVRIKTQKK